MSSKKTILVAGANGQLGLEFQSLSNLFPQYNFLFAGRNKLQIADEDSILKYFADNKIDICINCAAYTAVDKAETEKELAIAVNATAVGYLAKACKKYHTQFIHISTDYVFNGKASSPYKTDDETIPVNFSDNYR